MIIGTLENGSTCVYDLPKEIKTAEEFKSLIKGFNYNPHHRNGEKVTVIRYEFPSNY